MKMNAIQNLRISQKIFLLSVFMVILIAIVGSIGAMQMNKISNGLIEIVDEGIPMTQRITSLTKLKMEQAVLVERAFIQGLLLIQLIADNPKELKKILAALKDTNQKFSVELTNLRTFIQKALGKKSPYRIKERIPAHT